jgi:hypothetical protein
MRVSSSAGGEGCPSRVRLVVDRLLLAVEVERGELASEWGSSDGTEGEGRVCRGCGRVEGGAGRRMAGPEGSTLLGGG